VKNSIHLVCDRTSQAVYVGDLASMHVVSAFCEAHARTNADLRASATFLFDDVFGYVEWTPGNLRDQYFKIAGVQLQSMPLVEPREIRKNEVLHEHQYA
jgi:hypothetical protein